MLELESPLLFDEFVKPIPLIPKDVILTQLECCFTMGWGSSFPIPFMYYSKPRTLQKLKTQIIPNFFCKLAYPFLRDKLSTNVTVCASSGLFQGACQGDSGNSLVCYIEQVPYLVGLGSWGWGICGDGLHPDVYTDIRTSQSILKN